MIKNTCEVKVYEKNGVDLSPAETMTVFSHWNQSGMIHIQLPGCTDHYTVLASDLITAAANATNTNRNA